MPIVTPSASNQGHEDVRTACLLHAFFGLSDPGMFHTRPGSVPSFGPHFISEIQHVQSIYLLRKSIDTFFKACPFGLVLAL